jgi:vesicle-fusing ATPase
MGLSDAFNVQLHVPALRGEEAMAVMRAQDCFSAPDIPQVRACVWCCLSMSVTAASPQWTPHPTDSRLPLNPRPTPTQAVEAMSSLVGSSMVPLKKLLLWLEMARQQLPDDAAGGKIPLSAWMKVLRDLSS